MRTYLECIPCFLRQVLEIGRLITSDETVHKSLIDEACMLVPEISMNMPPPEIAPRIYSMIKAKCGDRDFYRDIKEKSNRMALNLYPKLKRKIEASDDRLLTALELAIMGNIIDYAAKNTLDIDSEIEKLFNGELDSIKKTTFHYDLFREDLSKAKIVLYLGDNAGEVVFDRAFIEEFYKEKEVFFAVRGSAVINDVLIEDAHVAGIDKVAKVISSGVDTPGLVLNRCSEDFLQIFREADIIISKGQGNYEALDGVDTDRRIYFLFRVKCPVIAKHAGVSLGEIALLKGDR